MLSQTKALHYTHKVQIVICEKCSPFCLFSFQAALDFHSRFMHPSKQHDTGSSIRHHCDWMWPSDDWWMCNDPARPNNLELNILQFKANRQFFCFSTITFKIIFSLSFTLSYTDPPPLANVCLPYLILTNFPFTRSLCLSFQHNGDLVLTLTIAICSFSFLTRMWPTDVHYSPKRISSWPFAQRAKVLVKEQNCPHHAFHFSSAQQTE